MGGQPAIFFDSQHAFSSLPLKALVKLAENGMFHCTGQNMSCLVPWFNGVQVVTSEKEMALFVIHILLLCVAGNWLRFGEFGEGFRNPLPHRKILIIQTFETSKEDK